MKRIGKFCHLAGATSANARLIITAAEARRKGGAGTETAVFTVRGTGGAAHVYTCGDQRFDQWVRGVIIAAMEVRRGHMSYMTRDVNLPKVIRG